MHCIYLEYYPKSTIQLLSILKVQINLFRYIFVLQFKDKESIEHIERIFLLKKKKNENKKQIKSKANKLKKNQKQKQKTKQNKTKQNK